MDVQQITRTNTLRTNSPSTGNTANILVIASLLFVVVLIVVVCAVAAGISVVLR